MSDENPVQDMVPSAAEMAEWDVAVERTVEGLKGKKAEAANLAANAVQFMSSSHEDLETVEKQGLLARFWGRLTGKNNKLRDRSQRNMLHGQKAALKLVQRLAEQNALQMDAMVALANLVNYLHFKNVETKKVLLALFSDHEARLKKLEERLDVVEKVYSWAFVVKNRDYIDLPSRSLRLVAFVQDALALGVSDWHSRDIAMFETALLDAGFKRRETITVRGFLHDLSQAEDAPGWAAHVLPLVEPGLEHVAEAGLPCYYALLESAALQRSEEKYCIITVATDLAAAQGSRLDPSMVREEVLARYLAGRGVNLDADVPVAKLGVELLVGARMVADVAPSAPTVVPELPPPEPGRVLRTSFYAFYGNRELRVHPDAAVPYAELVDLDDSGRRPIQGTLEMQEIVSYKDYWIYTADGFGGKVASITKVQVWWKDGKCIAVEVSDGNRWQKREVRSASVD